LENTIYVGKYKIPENGVIPLPDSKIRVLNYYLGVKKGKDDRLTLVLEDGDFWAVICKLTDEEAEQLLLALETVLNRRGQFSICIPFKKGEKVE